MAEKTVNGVPLKDILQPYVHDATGVERIPGRSHRAIPLVIEEPDPKWHEDFRGWEQRIRTALENATGGGEHGRRVSVLAVNHVGSTSVPGLPAKPLIDIDLVLSSVDLRSEPAFVPALEQAGFEFRIREPAWHEHRYFYAREPVPANLHVWGPRCAEVERHRIFRDWLIAHDDDRDLYARVKRECAAVSREKGEDVQAYNARKEYVIREILRRAFEALGYLHVPADAA